jgi:putative oxidoreductase
MERVLGRYSEPIYSLTRIVVGFLFLCHGAQKVFGAFGGSQADNGLMWVAGVIEFAGGLLIALGLFTGWAAFIFSGQMAVAYFLAHQGQGLLPIENRGELAALYAWVFLLFASKGDGAWSLGAMRGGQSR